jgi:tetratricopeptide (TPR) repeat protein
MCQSIELKEEFSSTKQLYEEKKYKEALVSNNKALVLSAKEFGEEHLTTATLHENKGRLLIQTNDYYNAELVFKKVIDIRKKLLSLHDPSIAEAIDYLAVSYRKQEKYKLALEAHSEVLGIMAKVIANNPGQITELSRRSVLYRARAFQTKGDILIIEGKSEEALGNYKTALKIFERTLGNNSKEFKELKQAIQSNYK